MKHAARLSAVLVSCALIIGMPNRAAAQQLTGGVIRRPSPQSVGPNSFSVGSYNLNFPTTPVGGEHR